MNSLVGDIPQRIMVSSRSPQVAALQCFFALSWGWIGAMMRLRQARTMEIPMRTVFTSALSAASLLFGVTPALADPCAFRKPHPGVLRRGTESDHDQIRWQAPQT